MTSFKLCLFSILLVCNAMKILAENHNEIKNMEKFKIKALSDAVVAAIQDKTFVKFNEQLKFLIVHKSCEKFALKITENIMKKTSNITTAQSLSINESTLQQQIKIPITGQNIIFIESDTSFNQALNDKFMTTDFDFLEEFHIVVVSKVLTKVKVLEILKTVQQQSFILHTQILYFNETSELVEAIGFAGFDENCRFHTRKINFYNPLRYHWNSSHLHLKRYKNFNFCVIRVYSDVGKDRVTIDLIKNTMSALETILNFKLEVRYEENQQTVCDFNILNLNIQKSDSYHIFPCSVREFSLAYSTGEALGEFEKFILPFDFATWILIIFYFIFGILFIIIIKYKFSIEFQNFVFGQTKTPIFNMVVAFFGQTQINLPERNFARYHLILFILFCHIIRTAYQGIQFEQMTTVS